MILAHELAHVRRRDPLVNALQHLVETALFYHPAVWWVSHVMRGERESCCDDVATKLCGNPLAYAETLARLERLRGPGPLVLAGSGGRRRPVIERLLGVQGTTAEQARRWSRSARAWLGLFFWVLPVSWHKVMRRRPRLSTDTFVEPRRALLTLRLAEKSNVGELPAWDEGASRTGPFQQRGDELYPLGRHTDPLRLLRDA